MNADKIVFFDGVCTLCNKAVDVIISNDKKDQLHFSSLQSNFANNFLSKFEVDNSSLDTIIYYEDGALYYKSDAILKIAKHLSVFKHFSFLRIIPRFLRDAIYTAIAKSRYQLFGKKDTCRLPTKAEAQRFLDS